MCLHKARLAANTFLCGVDSEQWPQCWMAFSVGPRVSCLLLQMPSNPFVGTGSILHFALSPVCEHLITPVKLYGKPWERQPL